MISLVNLKMLLCEEIIARHLFTIKKVILNVVEKIEVQIKSL